MAILLLHTKAIQIKKNSESDIIIYKSNLESKSNQFRGKFNAINLEKTNVINLSLIDPVSTRGVDYLNALVSQYNEDAIKDRNQIAEFTKKFINKRLKIITEELGGVEGQAEVFKKNRNLTSVDADADVSLNSAIDYNKSVLGIETDLKVSEFMLNEINNTKQYDLIATNILSFN